MQKKKLNEFHKLKLQCNHISCYTAAAVTEFYKCATTTKTTLTIPSTQTFTKSCFQKYKKKKKRKKEENFTQQQDKYKTRKNIYKCIPCFRFFTRFFLFFIFEILIKSFCVGVVKHENCNTPV